MKDYYRVLEVSEHASREVIHAAYKILAKKYHPDSVALSSLYDDKMREINEAYSVLSDDFKRSQYDWERTQYLRKAKEEEVKRQTYSCNPYSTTYAYTSNANSSSSANWTERNQQHQQKTQSNHEKKEPKHKKSAFGVLCILLVMVLGVWLSIKILAPQGSSLAAEKSNSNKENNASESMVWYKLESRADANDSKTGNELDSYFTLGYPSEKVKSIMGVPDSISHYDLLGDTWYYGSSSINFDVHGKVEGWFSGNTKLSVFLGNKVADSYFTLGSDKATVLKAMGTPTGITHYDSLGDTWYYGSSSISFDVRGKVEGWTTGNVRLKIK